MDDNQNGPVAPPPAPKPIERLRQGHIFVVFASDSQKPETFERVQIKAEDKSFRLTHDRAVYEHTADDIDGAWIYTPAR